MSSSRNHFVGQAGQFHVAYCLSVRGYHAAITLGNAPNVDILLSASDGSKLLSLQVKTSTSAHRAKRYGFELCEWDVGESAVGHSNENFWYAFVDLQEKTVAGHTSWNPMVYIVPSTWVASMVTSNYSRKIYFLRNELWAECAERWDKIDGYFNRDPNTLSWINNIPIESTNTW